MTDEAFWSMIEAEARDAWHGKGRYPLRAYTERVEVNREALTVQWKGGTVLDVQPHGAAPVPYQRAHLARASTPWQPANPYPTLAARLSALGS